MPPCPSAAFLNMSKAPHSRASPSRCYRFRTRAGCWPASPGVFWNAPICLSAGRDCASPGQGSRALRPVERPHGGLRPWSACRRQPSDFPGWACSECPARATATTTSTVRPPFIGRLGERLRLGLQPSARRPAASLRLPRDYGHRAAPCDPTALLLGRHEEDSHDAPACSSAGILYPC